MKKLLYAFALKLKNINYVTVQTLTNNRIYDNLHQTIQCTLKKEDLMGENISVLKKYVKKPYQRVKLANVEIWTNRVPEKWHIQFPSIDNPIMHRCPDKRCPHDHHLPLKDYDLSDPWSLGAIFKLKPGMKILVLIERFEKQYVSYFTFKNFNNYLGPIQFYSKELSKDLYFFSETKNKLENFGVNISWDSMKYLAIVDSSEPAFGKYGQVPCFIEELKRLSGESKKNIEEALKKLDSLNPIPKRPKLKNPGIFLANIYIDYSDKKDIVPQLKGYPCNDTVAKELAFLYLFLSEMGEFDSFVKKLNGWKFGDNDALKKALKEACDWYLKIAPSQKILTDRWQKKWQKTFAIV